MKTQLNATNRLLSATQVQIQASTPEEEAEKLMAFMKKLTGKKYFQARKGAYKGDSDRLFYKLPSDAKGAEGVLLIGMTSQKQVFITCSIEPGYQWYAGKAATAKKAVKNLIAEIENSKNIIEKQGQTASPSGEFAMNVLKPKLEKLLPMLN